MSRHRCAQSYYTRASGRPTGEVYGTWEYDVTGRPFYSYAKNTGTGFTDVVLYLPTFGGDLGFEMCRPVFIDGSFFGALFVSTTIQQLSDFCHDIFG